MTIESEFKVWNVTATEDLTANSAMYHAVSILGTIAASPAMAIGVLRGKAVLGAQAPVVIEGITKVVAGAVITTPGYPIANTTSGFFIAAVSGGVHCGRYLGGAACASGDLVSAYVDFTSKPQYPGL